MVWSIRLVRWRRGDFVSAPCPVCSQWDFLIIDPPRSFPFSPQSSCCFFFYLEVAGVCVSLYLQLYYLSQALAVQTVRNEDLKDKAVRKIAKLAYCFLAREHQFGVVLIFFLAVCGHLKNVFMGSGLGAFPSLFFPRLSLRNQVSFAGGMYFL